MCNEINRYQSNLIMVNNCIEARQNLIPMRSYKDIQRQNNKWKSFYKETQTKIQEGKHTNRKRYKDKIVRNNDATAHILIQGYKLTYAYIYTSENTPTKVH